MSTDEDLQFMGALPYFRGLSAAELTEIRARCSTRALEVGEMIVMEGQPPPAALYVVRRGRVRVFNTSVEGKREQVLTVIDPGGVFNDAAVFDDGPSLASAQAAASDTSVYVVPGLLVIRLLMTNPPFARNVARILAGRVRQITGLVRDLAFRHSIQRLATLLIEESAATGGPVRLTQQEMATRVGTVREVVSRVLRDLEARGLITRQRQRIVQVDAAALRALLEWDTDGSL